MGTMEEMKEYAAARVARGAELLDATPEVPFEWRNMVVAAKVDFNNGAADILGQVLRTNPQGNSGYAYGMDVLFNTQMNENAYFMLDNGFTAGNTENGQYVDATVLIQAWKDFFESNVGRSLLSELTSRKVRLERKLTDYTKSRDEAQAVLDQSLSQLAEYDMVLAAYPQDAPADTVAVVSEDSTSPEKPF